MTKTAPFFFGLAPLGLALTAGLLAAGSADAGRISPNLLDLAKRNVTTPVGVIVRFRLPDTGQGRAAFKTLRSQLQGAIAQLGPAAGFVNGALKQSGAELWLDQSIYLKMTPGQARLVATLPIVDEVFENFKVQVPRAVALSAASAPAGTPWHLQNIGAPQAWAAGFRGQGIRIGHLDTGIDAGSPELAGKIAAFQEFNADGDKVSSGPHDTEQHGTHTAGLLVGKTVGVAPDAKVLSALVLPNSEGTFAQVIAGMQWVLDPDNNADTNDGANVVSMSLGLPGTYQEFVNPVQNMLKAGVIPVFAIGNFGPNPGSTGSPGNIPDVIGVGAVDQSGNVAGFSSRGPVTWTGAFTGTFVKPDVVAPGVDITSSYPGGGYGSRSGTSQAAPIAAGAVAVLLSAKPGSSIDTIKNALYGSASNAGNKNNTVGYGTINLPGALGKLGVNTGNPAPAPQPAPVPQPAPAPQPAPQPAPAQPTGPGGFALCATEGSKCNFSGEKQVAYGTAGKYNYANKTNGVECSNVAFGDPAPGVLKGCFIRDIPQTQQPAPTPAPAPAPSTGKKPSILLVDDDRGQGADVTANLRDAIKANAATGGAFVLDRARGAIPASELNRYDVVIWATGEQYENTLDAGDQQALQQYLAQGGRLIVTGQDIGYDIGSGSFYRDILKTRFVADSSGTAKFVTSGALGNVAYNLNAAGSAQNQFYPDVISNIGSSVVAATWGSAGANAGTITAQSIRVDQNQGRAAQKTQDVRGLVQNIANQVIGNVLGSIFGQQAAQKAPVQKAPAQRVQAQFAKEEAGAIVLNDAGKYRTVTMGFGLEGLTPTSRSELLKDTLNWLLR